MGHRLLLEATDALSSTGGVDALVGWFARCVFFNYRTLLPCLIIICCRIAPLLYRSKIRKALVRHQVLVIDVIAHQVKSLQDEYSHQDPVAHDLFKHLPHVAGTPLVSHERLNQFL